MTDINIVIPKGCNCVNVAMGSYGNQVELPTPAHMLELGSIGCLTFRETTCVDRCIAPAVQAIWALGVVTTGCCCGHSTQDGYIGFWQPGQDQADDSARLDALDAERYRRLRDLLMADDSAAFALLMAWPSPGNSDEFDAAIDAARERGDG